MDPLFVELQSLARRYGVEKVDATWKRTKDKLNADSKRLRKKPIDGLRKSLEIKDGDCGKAFTTLFSVNFGPVSRRTEWDLSFSGCPPTKTVFNSIIESLIFSQRQKVKHSVESAFHTLSFPCGEPHGKKYLTLIKNGMECMNIFEKVIMVGRPSIDSAQSSSDFPMIDYELLYYIKEATVRTNEFKSLTLSSVKISACAATLLQWMIESNRLTSLSLADVQVSPEASTFASKIVTRGFSGLTMVSHPNSGMLNLRKLSISQGFVDEILPSQAKALFRAISAIESLQEFCIGTSSEATLDRLTELNFKSLKRLDFYFRSNDNAETYPDFKNLFELVDRSKELVSFHPFIKTDDAQQVDWSYTEQLMNLALRSGGSRLLEIEASEDFFHTHDLSDLTLPESPTLQDVQLRKFTLFSHDSGVETMFEDRDHDDLVRDLTTLLDLVRNHLCYLFDIGLGYRPEEYIFSLVEHNADAIAIFQQIMVQLERNRVGTRLLTLRPRVPRGLWPLVLELAADNRCSRFCEPDCISKDVPWTAIYEVVQALVSTGQLGSTKEEDSMICKDDRRKRQRISKTGE